MIYLSTGGPGRSTHRHQVKGTASFFPCCLPYPPLATSQLCFSFPAPSPEFLAQKLEHGAFVRLRTLHLNGKPKVLTLKLDLHYWPTWELRFDASSGTWHRSRLTSPSASPSAVTQDATACQGSKL